MPDGVEALRQLGVTIPESEAYPFRGIRFVSDGTKAAAEFPRGTAYGIRRTHLHRVLSDQAAASGVRMLWQAAVTGLHPEGALVAGELVRARWVVGADGTSSRVRGWANLGRRELDADLNATSNATQKKNLRFAFRRHYRVAPWTDFMELHWGRHCQIYVTPVGGEEVCVALISSSPKLRLEDATRGISGTLRTPRRCRARIQRTGRNHRHPKIAARVSRPHRVGGRRLGRSGRHHWRRPLPCLPASCAAGRLPGQRRPCSLSKSSSHDDPPSGVDGAHDVVHGQTQSCTAAHHAGIPVEPTLICWNVRDACGRRLGARLHLERNSPGVGTAEGVTYCGSNCGSNGTHLCIYNRYGYFFLINLSY